MLHSLVHLVQQGIIPMQLLVVLIGLMPKYTGGERPIALTAMLYRLVMKLNKANITQWDAAKAEFWDTALKGSSCLRAALCRALKVEVATAQGFASVGFFMGPRCLFRFHQVAKADEGCFGEGVSSLDPLPGDASPLWRQSLQRRTLCQPVCQTNLLFNTGGMRMLHFFYPFCRV